MKLTAKHKMNLMQRLSRGRATFIGARSRRWGTLRPGGETWLRMGSYLLIVALTTAAVCLWRTPLSSSVPTGAAVNPSASPAVVGREKAVAALELCLRQIKMRDLFKPSVPVPSENRIGKSTAQELANRLQFVGIMGDSDGMAALVLIPNRGPGTFRVGDRVAEFTLKDITSDQLMLELGDEKAVLKR